MQVYSLPLKDAFYYTADVHTDKRGSFTEIFNEDRFFEITGDSIKYRFVQDNYVRSRKNVIRGLHFQREPYAQGKLIRCTQGSIFDVLVDLRVDSNTFRESFCIILNSDDNEVLWVPPGFAHGYMTLERDTCVHYKVTTSYKPDFQETLAWDDPQLNIPWPINFLQRPLLSDKDRNEGCLLRKCYYFNHSGL